MDPTTTARNLELQRQWYGAPLGEHCRDLCALFGVTQSGLAEVIGISPAMLSLVMRGQRARIANPDAAARLSALLHLAHEVRAGSVPPDAVARRLAEVRSSRTPGQDSLGAAVPTAPPAEGGGPAPEADLRFVRRLRELLTATSGAVDLLDAADLVAARHPGLAEILRTCGAGRTDEAVALVRRLIG
ncbi:MULTISPECIES: DNA-binding protein [Streptomyces]|uniref:DNA-binding protein n=2 Tax=Streptomyces TaxID=1883 RepID=A0ABU4KFU2_9ACTN|nr:DNA-binding protein [Streptomyces roseolus]MDX2296664.1 DNA-binding protein [Streptomyces roseolus]